MFADVELHSLLVLNGQGASSNVPQGILLTTLRPAYLGIGRFRARYVSSAHAGNSEAGLLAVWVDPGVVVFRGMVLFKGVVVARDVVGGVVFDVVEVVLVTSGGNAVLDDWPCVSTTVIEDGVVVSRSCRSRLPSSAVP